MSRCWNAPIARCARPKARLNLVDLDPLDAIRKLTEFKFDYYLEHPKIIRLLAFENMQNARS